MADDDPQTSYLISAWARMCKILGKQFEQYLPLVMGPVMRTAALKPNVTMLDNDEIEDIENDADWSYINLGEQQNFAIRTAGMDDKACACEMLVCYARELKEGFAGYAEEVVRLMVPMLKFYFHDGVRSAAAESIPYLLDCAKIKGPQYLEGMWLYICPELLKAIDSEPETDVLAELLHSLARSIETLGPNCLSPESMDSVLKIIQKFMAEHFEREEKRALARTEEDYDDGVEEQLAEEDDNDILVLSKVADIIHALFKTYKTAFLPFFDRVAPSFVKLLDPSGPWADRQWGLCIFDEVIGKCRNTIALDFFEGFSSEYKLLNGIFQLISDFRILRSTLRTISTRFLATAIGIHQRQESRGSTSRHIWMRCFGTGKFCQKTS